MGLIKAGTGAIGSVLADQWKEYFYCDSIDVDVLAVKGKKRISGRSSNTKGSDNVISNGSVIAVADGQCMMIVDQGKVAEFSAESGEFIYDSSTEPSIFAGSLGKGILDTFKTIGRRFAFGGDVGKDQRVYYFNLKEIVDNKFGTANPIPFRVVDRNIGLDIDVSVRCNGIFSYKITDPMLFYTNVCGNVDGDYTRREIDSQLKTEFISALQPSFAKISEMEVRPSALPGHAEKLAELMNETLTAKWCELRGISVVSIALNPITLTPEDAELIKQAQRAAILRDPSMAAATLTEAQAEAMKGAANNSSGAMNGFIGMGMAVNAGGGVNAQSLYEMGAKQNGNSTAQSTQGGWTCQCGKVNNTKFCSECGEPKPSDGWVCSCGVQNLGKFCHECGKQKPTDAPLYRCDKCGWQPEDPKNPPKFCPECGDRFDEADSVKQ